MLQVKDLNLEEEILPLFDYSKNPYAKDKIRKLLHTPLGSIREITDRQELLASFRKNQSILMDYSYNFLYFREVHQFTTSIKPKDLPDNIIRYRLFTPRAVKEHHRSRFVQLILLFHRLEFHYFSRIDLKLFPEDFARVLHGIREVLNRFELRKYEEIIREKFLKDHHILALFKILRPLLVEKRFGLFWEDFFLFEAFVSISKGNMEHGLTNPGFDLNGITLKQCYHPILTDPVKNDFATSGNVVVLNGPNMSGKSTFLKAVALCMYLGHLGFGVPATAATLPFCTGFSIFSTHGDDLRSGYSHFMTEVLHLKDVVVSANTGISCFAVFDELFSGTNMEDALEICTTTIKGLSRFSNSFFFISTHIEGLKPIAKAHAVIYYMDCSLENEQPRFTYELKKGWSDIKVGQILFEKEGLNKMLGG